MDITRASEIARKVEIVESGVREKRRARLDAFVCAVEISTRGRWDEDALVRRAVQIMEYVDKEIAKT